MSDRAAEMMSTADFTPVGQSTSALIEAVVQTNLRAMHELLRAGDQKAMLELQRQFACEYMTVLMRGTMAVLNTIEAATAA